MDLECVEKSCLCGTTRVDCGETQGTHEHDRTSRGMGRRPRPDPFDGDMVDGARCFGESSRLLEDGSVSNFQGRYAIRHAWNRVSEPGGLSPAELRRSGGCAACFIGAGDISGRAAWMAGIAGLAGIAGFVVRHAKRKE